MAYPPALSRDAEKVSGFDERWDSESKCPPQAPSREPPTTLKGLGWGAPPPASSPGQAEEAAAAPSPAQIAAALAAADLPTPVPAKKPAMFGVGKGSPSDVELMLNRLSAGKTQLSDVGGKGKFTFGSAPPTAPVDSISATATTAAAASTAAAAGVPLPSSSSAGAAGLGGCDDTVGAVSSSPVVGGKAETTLGQV